MSSISIVVPVYNVEAYLPQCIDSIRRQTFSDIEIVCVVDGSTDRSELILRCYERVDDRMRIIVQENGGLSSARNTGIEACSSPYIMFVDSDDMLTNDACQKVYDAFNKQGAEIVTFGAQCYPQSASTEWFEAVFSPRDTYYDSFEPAILFEEASHPFVWRTAVSKEFLLRTGLRFDETVRFGEDQIFHFAAYPKAHGVSFVPDKLYKYRVVRDGSLMAASFSDKRQRLLDHAVIAEHICSDWKQDGIMDRFGTLLCTWCVDFLLYDFMIADTEYRDELIKRLGLFLREQFTHDQVENMDVSQPIRDVCLSLRNGSDISTQRSAYLRSIGYVEGGASSGIKGKLRNAVRMSAFGLADRFDSAESKNELAHWLTVDSLDALRSFEILRLELSENERA